MRERAEAMVLASFAADSHALGAHWIYDMDEIASRYGRVEQLLPAPPDSFHAGRALGSFTHYGDQALVLLRHLASHKRYDAASFAAEWREAMSSYDGYLDHATQSTLEAMERTTDPTAAGSSSTDLSAAARVAPVVYLYRDEHDRIGEMAAAQAAVTHNSAPVLETATFLGNVMWHVLNGKTPTVAISGVAEKSHDSSVSALVRAGLESVESETRDAAMQFGQGCATASALPLAIHLIAKYEGSLKRALVENVAAGGDSAARGMLVGMVLGGFHGRDAIPDDWIAEMRAYREITALLEDLEAVLQRAGATTRGEG